jgi:nucleoside-diphosphate-sugar epimerase
MANLLVESPHSAPSFADRQVGSLPARKRSEEKRPQAVVTGASGFIGMHLVQRLLREGQRVRVLMHRSPCPQALQSQGAEVIRGGLDDLALLKDAVQGADVVYHVAGLTSATNEADLLRVNGEGSRNLAQACAAQAKSPTLLYVSSVAAAGPTSREHVRVERELPAPVSRYGRSKLAGEIAIAEFASEVPITIVRPGIVFGPQNRETLPMFQSIQWLNTHAVMGMRAPILSLVYVDDLIEIILRAALQGTRLPMPCGVPLQQLSAGRGVYFAAAAEHPDYAEFGKWIAAELQRPFVLPVYIPGSVAAAAIGFFESLCWLRGTSSSVNRDKLLEASAASWACSGELVRRELGFTMPYSLRERLHETVAWYRAQRWL